MHVFGGWQQGCQRQTGKHEASQSCRCIELHEQSVRMAQVHLGLQTVYEVKRFGLSECVVDTDTIQDP